MIDIQQKTSCTNAQRNWVYRDGHASLYDLNQRLKNLLYTLDRGICQYLYITCSAVPTDSGVSYTATRLERRLNNEQLTLPKL